MLIIKKWEVFECPTVSRRPKGRMDWHCVPVEPNSSGRLSLLSLGESGLIAYGVFMMLVQYSATQPIELRGSLQRANGDRLTDQQLCQILMLDAKVWSRAVKTLKSVGWLVETDCTTEQALRSSEQAVTSRDKPANDLSTTVSRGEEIREEEKREDNKRVSLAFKIPTVLEVVEYMDGIGKYIDAEKFHDHYSSNGWKVGRNAMKCWKSTARNWHRREPAMEQKANGGKTTFHQQKEQNTVSSLVQWSPSKKGADDESDARF